MSEKDAINKIEAVLFISGRFLSVEELVMFTGLNPIMIKELIENLKEHYKDGGICIVERNNKYKMDVKQNYTYLINKLASGSAEFSKAEQETLAVVAYKQPIKQSIIIKIRGNKAYDHIKHFIEAGLLRSKKVGRTLELNLSENFYNYFTLKKK